MNTGQTVGISMDQNGGDTFTLAVDFGSCSVRYGEVLVAIFRKTVLFFCGSAAYSDKL
jgi:hypothetical protein